MPGTWLLGRAAQDAAGEGRAQTPTGERTARAVLVAVEAPGEQAGPGPSLDELERLADTDGVVVAERLVQSRAHPDPATYLGSGKVQELAEVVQRTGADLVIADDELSPGQVRNLEERTGVRVVDRTALILDIFAGHAHSSEGRTQVELAQIAYQLPRLRGRGQEMSRVGGGRVAGGAGMGVRGPGETRLESERRRLRRRAANLRKQTQQIARRRQRTRARRSRNEVPSVAITGYTNAGKSALLNRLTGSDVLVQGVLFATLDPTVRRVGDGGSTYTLTDTVGFVRNLPHQLVDAFRSTLEEVVEADLALHVVDAAAPDAMAQVTTVRGVLSEVGAAQVPELLVLNKVDVAPQEWVQALQRAYPDAVAVSAVTGQGVPELREAIASRLRDLEGRLRAGG
ncbi:GTPase HflX [Kineococcus arenarius]|uniref:GTPase HflX n=1 Tax=Kineococcus sp. SYSU DK007 TaxID=3383128 RepID=UPI003D7EEE4D